MPRFVFVFALFAVACGTSTTATPGFTTSHGSQSLGDLMAAYWRWTLTGADPATASAGDVTYLGIPAGTDPDGDGTFSGSLATSVGAGQTIVMPLFVWIGESYTAASGMTPDVPDTAAPRALFTGTALHVRLTVDATTVFDTAEGDSLDEIFFDTEDFTPPIPYETPTDYGADAAIWVRGIGVLVNPLPTGTHTIHLVERQDDAGVGYDNTWTVTVP